MASNHKMLEDFYKSFFGAHPSVSLQTFLEATEISMNTLVSLRWGRKISPKNIEKVIDRMLEIDPQHSISFTLLQPFLAKTSKYYDPKKAILRSSNGLTASELDAILNNILKRGIDETTFSPEAVRSSERILFELIGKIENSTQDFKP